MSKALGLYKAFIDGLGERKDSMTALCVKDGGFPNPAKNRILENYCSGVYRYIDTAVKQIEEAIKGEEVKPCVTRRNGIRLALMPLQR